MARQTPQQKRANADFAKTIEKNMGRPQAAIKKKDAQKSPISTPMLSKFPLFFQFLFQYLFIYCLSILMYTWITNVWFHNVRHNSIPPNSHRKMIFRISTNASNSLPRIRGSRNSRCRLFWDRWCTLGGAEESTGEGWCAVIINTWIHQILFYVSNV